MILANYGVVSSSGGAINYDADALAFMTAASITDNTQKTAINTLVTDLKINNIWTKMKAIYPFVGGSATSHKFNLKDPRDLDAAYRLVFNGGWTHSSTGALPNGTTGYADTKLIPSSTLILNSTHISVYSRTNLTGDYADLGVIQGTGSSYLQLLTKWSNNIFYGTIYDSNFLESYIVSDSLGLFIGNRQSSTTVKLIKNSTVITDKISYSAIALPLGSVYLGARNSSNINNLSYSPRQQAFASIGDGLSDTEAANFYTAVQAYQTSLGRQV